MRNVSLRTTQQPYAFVTYSANGCLVLKNSNVSFANWENIPDTVLLNGTFGVVLMVLFSIFTHMAWRRLGPYDDSIYKQNIINFLYGYREPDNWYVIPRYEFLRPKERHHCHDLEYPYLYIPPKLPLANPIEAFAFESDSVSDNIYKSTLDLHGRLSKSSSKISQNTERSPSSLKSSSPATNTLKFLKSTGSYGLISKTSSNAFTQSFFYPSILTAEQTQASSLSKFLNRIFSKFFGVTDADIIYARGIDAYEYLLFQRYLILILMVTNILCIFVILPIHWYVGSRVNLDKVLATSFQRTTIKNMDASSHFHWAHIICSAAIVLASLRLLGSYKESITTKNESQLSRRTLLIGNIPQERRSRSQLSRTLVEYFPNMNIEAIQFVYDFSSLYDYESYLSTAIVAKDYCRAYRSKNNRELMIPKSNVNQERRCDGYCRLCSFFYTCCARWPFEGCEPGTEYYAREEKFYREKIAVAFEKTLNEPTEYAFVTFKTHRQARSVMLELTNLKHEALEDVYKTLQSRGRPVNLNQTTLSVEPLALQPATKTPLDETIKDPLDSKDGNNKYLQSGNKDSDPLDPINDPHVRSVRSPQRIDRRQIVNAIKLQRIRHGPLSPIASVDSDKLGAIKSNNTLESAPSRFDDSPLLWSVRYAPLPDNVEFDDLRHLAQVGRYTGILLHLLMIIIFIFVTTPNVLLSMIERVAIIRPDRAKQLTGFRSLMINYSSILLQIILTSLLPSLITLISRLIPYEDSSSKNHSVMWKVYLFLVLMVIVMPSIGMSSAQSLLVSDIDPKCLFPTDNGAYYINYVISSTFLSTLLELIKPTDILYYYFILWTSRSTAELEGGRQFIEREFSVGLQHTSVLLVFAVVMTYSISCPLIAPVGLIYLCVKHSVDHYHLYYTYFTKKVDKDMQSTIMIFVKVALLLMLFQTSVAISLNTGTSYFSLISQIIFWISLVALAFNCFVDYTAKTNQGPAVDRNKNRQDFCACFYLPKVIDNLLKLNAIPHKYVSSKL